MGTLSTALEGLPDRRTLKGRRYSLASIAGLSFSAMLSGANDLRAIFRWGRRLTPKGLAMLGIDRGRTPCHATYHYVFRAIPAADLERVLGAAVRPDGPLRHVAIDGKRLRSSQHETSPGVHMLQAISIRLQASIGSPVVPLEGAVVTGCRLHDREDRTGHPGPWRALLPVRQRQPAGPASRNRPPLRR